MDGYRDRFLTLADTDYFSINVTFQEGDIAYRVSQHDEERTSLEVAFPGWPYLYVHLSRAIIIVPLSFPVFISQPQIRHKNIYDMLPPLPLFQTTSNALKTHVRTGPGPNTKCLATSFFISSFYYVN